MYRGRSTSPCARSPRTNWGGEKLNLARQRLMPKSKSAARTRIWTKPDRPADVCFISFYRSNRFERKTGCIAPRDFRVARRQSKFRAVHHDAAAADFTLTDQFTLLLDGD